MILVILCLKLILQISKKYKSPGSDEILAELIKAGGKILKSEV
jgi:amino acid permease